MARLPVVGADADAWGARLNEFLSVGHNSDGTLKSSGGYLSVRDYGAAGDGSTDDGDALQAAIDAAGPNKAVFFPAGVYLTSQTINLKPGGSYFGVGPQSVIKQANSANLLVIMQWPNDGVTKKFCRMRDLAIDGNRANNGSVTTYGLAGWFVQWSEFFNVRVQEVNGDGFRFDGASDGNFDHVSSTNYFLDCWAYGCTNAGMVLGSGAGDCHVIAGNFGDNGSAAIALQAGSCTITGSVLWGSRYGPGLSLAGTDAQIRGCAIEGNAHQGVLVHQWADHSLLADNKVYANSTAGTGTYDAIRADGASGDNLVGLTLVSNKIYTDLYSGVLHKSAISLGTNHTNAIIVGNVVGFAGANAGWTPDAASLINGTNATDTVGHNPGVGTFATGRITATERLRVTGSVPATVAFAIDGASGQTANLFEARNSAGVTGFYVDANTVATALARSAATTPLRAKGAAGQTADLQRWVDNTDTVLAAIGPDGSLSTKAGVGFYGTAPGAKPTVTGSRGGNAALASLLTALAGMGLITNNTTA